MQTNRRPARVVRLATVAWIGLLLSVSLERGLPTLPHAATSGTQAIGVAAALLVVFWSHPATPLTTGERNLFGTLLIVPATAALLAVYRGETGPIVSHAASALALMMAARLDARSRVDSAWRALVILIAGSALLGLVYPPAIEVNDRAFLRPLYSGRLVGLLQTPNFLGVCAAVLAVISLTAYTGRRRTWGVMLALFAIAAASSQTSLGCVLLALALMWVAREWKRGAAGPLVVMGLLVLAAVVAWLFWLTARPNNPMSISDLIAQFTFSSRRNIWEFLLQQADVPFTGIGQTQLGTLFDYNTIHGATQATSAHNVFLDGYMRDGWPGLTAVGAAYLGMIWFSYKARTIIAIVPLSAVLIESNLEVSPSHVPLYALFAVTVSYAIWLTAQQPLSGESGPEGDDRRRGQGAQGAGQRSGASRVGGPEAR